ncbi:MAG: type II toxin-antitoxin system prevent-host-death family antitoxin [Luteolibacter sp.]
MKTMTIRDIRQHWPEAERRLAEEREIIITRDGKPVARLLPVEEVVASAKKFDPEAHLRWMKETFGDEVLPDSTPWLMEDREDRTW